jgi:NADH dehydrogenase [ubiquinone] 1 alpha subcomplex assembly factor 1
MVDKNKSQFRDKLKVSFLLFVLFSAFAVDHKPASGDQSASQKLITDFQSKNERKNWRIVNDVIMGGISRSELIISNGSIAVFKGNLSLENNGGFASVQTFPANYNLSGFDGVAIRVRGDGKKYQARLKMGSPFDGISYKAPFQTAPEKWTTVFINFGEFSPSYRGRLVRDAPALDPEQIRQIGFLIAGKQKGPFQLEINWIKAYKQ